jgi:hypothetical protein
MVKERFENEASSSARCLHNDPIFEELRRFCTRAAWNDICLWTCCWYALLERVANLFNAHKARVDRYFAFYPSIPDDLAH